jgi:ribosome biogenesis GTPase
VHADEAALAGLGLARLGWTTGDDEALAAAGGGVPARVVVEHRDRYELVDATGVRIAQTSGRLRKLAAEDPLERPVVGDWVIVEGARIEARLPRRTAIVRKAAGRRMRPQVVVANVDVVMVVTAAGVDVNPRRLERYASMIAESGARAVVVLS